MIITPPARQDVSGHAAEMYADDESDDGFVHFYTQAMAINPDAHEAFVALIRAIVPSIGIRGYDVATLGAARAIGSPHCLLAHGRKSLNAEVVDERGLLAFAHDDDSGFDEAERAIIRYAAKLSTDPGEMTEADTADLRAHGYDDRQIVDLTLAAAARNYFSRALLALAVPVDRMPGLTTTIADALMQRGPR